MTLIDSNVLLDVFTDDPQWREWSEENILLAAGRGDIAINPVVYAEIAPAFRTSATLDRALGKLDLLHLPLPYEAGWPAAQAFLAYRKRGGTKRSPLPDFYIGAHAYVENLTLLTRDSTRYRTYFPKLALVHP
jgi:predicted nucleic acid-binding protein